MPHPNSTKQDEWRRRLVLVGARLRRYRKHKGLTQAQVAVRIGLGSKKPVTAWEGGKNLPPLWALLLLSRLLSRQVIDITAPLDDYARQLVQKDVDEPGPPP